MRVAQVVVLEVPAEVEERGDGWVAGAGRGGEVARRNEDVSVEGVKVVVKGHGFLSGGVGG